MRLRTLNRCKVDGWRNPTHTPDTYTYSYNNPEEGHYNPAAGGKATTQPGGGAAGGRVTPEDLVSFSAVRKLVVGIVC